MRVPTKMLVCLANSYKHSERCVAGIEISSRKWIRPVSSRPSRGVSTAERHYAGGSEPQVLDIVDVPLRGPQPLGFQQENWLLDATRQWRKVGRLGLTALAALESPRESLWLNGASTSRGSNDRVPDAAAQPIRDSLRLIGVDRATVQVMPDPWSPGGHLSVRIQFAYASFAYNLKVTDPVYRAKFQAKGVGSYKLGKSYLTISLSEAYDDGSSYKLVAAIVEAAGLDSRTA
ncbi:dual OB domain-containing protein [Amycolatopsis sp. GA6-003]|uniref:dual OB domain-containing protein n=1 Tax=Amycolatopsis sp. GA6-003 TaxID=2652444 RepID=UPI0039176660